MKANEIIIAARVHLESAKNRSAWSRGVNAYADDMLDDLLDWYPEIVENGTRSDVEKRYLTARRTGALTAGAAAR